MKFILSLLVILLFISCKKNKLASIYTSPVTSISNNSALSGGTITDNGKADITAKGLVWSTSPNPTLTNNIGVTNLGVGNSSFSSEITGLTANITYYVRAYAVTSQGTAYGNEISFTTTFLNDNLNPNLSYGSMTDQNGNSYATIVIGNQEWMAENLKAVTYRNGDTIPNVTDDFVWNNLNSGAWSHYENNSNFENPYGKLYNWYVVSDPRNVCPTGWHVPSDSEWTELTDYLGGAAIAGGKMKSINSALWLNPNTNATNESGLSLLPGGGRYSNSFGWITKYGDWWSTTEIDFGNAYDRNLGYSSGSADKYARLKTDGFSIRCIRD
jgi:uncharacterized protein (TIGR02145 family)